MSSIVNRERALNVFCQQIEKFCIDIRKILPEDDFEADLILTGLRTMLQFNSDMVSKFIYDNIALPYEDMLLKRDEAFLTGELSSKMGGGPFADLHHKIESRWSTMSDSNKNIIWDYFKVIVILTKRLN
jgi:hypothetical protein